MSGFIAQFTYGGVRWRLAAPRKQEICRHCRRPLLAKQLCFIRETGTTGKHLCQACGRKLAFGDTTLAKVDTADGARAELVACPERRGKAMRLVWRQQGDDRHWAAHSGDGTQPNDVRAQMGPWPGNEFWHFGWRWNAAGTVCASFGSREGEAVIAGSLDAAQAECERLATALLELTHDTGDGSMEDVNWSPQGRGARRYEGVVHGYHVAAYLGSDERHWVAELTRCISIGTDTFRIEGRATRLVNAGEARVAAQALLRDALMFCGPCAESEVAR